MKYIAYFADLWKDLESSMWLLMTSIIYYDIVWQVTENTMNSQIYCYDQGHLDEAVTRMSTVKR